MKNPNAVNKPWPQNVMEEKESGTWETLNGKSKNDVHFKNLFLQVNQKKVVQYVDLYFDVTAVLYTTLEQFLWHVIVSHLCNIIFIENIYMIDKNCFSITSWESLAGIMIM